jgi:hypothetical protein
MRKLAQWHQTKLGLLVFGVIELAVAYGFASLAIDRGNLLYYLLAFILLVGSLQNLFRLVRSLMHGKEQAS